MNWYELSYDSFLNQPIKTKEDLIRIIAFAYSWMPTIPNINSKDVNWDRLIELVNELRQGNIDNRKELLSILIPIINNSIVGCSKVLHFIAPSLAPIIDSRVTRSWNRFFAEGLPGYSFKLPTSYYIKDAITLNSVINVYLNYWDAMKLQVIKSGKSLRELEFDLYSSGKT